MNDCMSINFYLLTNLSNLFTYLYCFQFSKESREYGTQTDEYDPFMALRETIIDGPGEDPCLDEGPVVERPSVNIPPTFVDARPRLSAVSATPIVDPDHITYPNHRKTVNAIVEAQPNAPPVNASQKSSPSQSSKTESAHEQASAVEEIPQNPVVGGSDSASRDIDSLDVEAHSDYDNNLSDLEDEGQGVAFSSDDLKPLHRNQHRNGDIHGVSSGSSDSDSSDGLDHEHFKELQKKRLINMKNKAASVPPSSNHDQPVLWEGYGNSVPLSNVNPYFNNYAEYNNDKIGPVGGKATTVPSETHRIINSQR